MEIKGSLLCSQEPAIRTHTKADQFESIPLHPVPRKSILKLFSHLCLGIASDLIPAGVPTKISYAFLFSPMYFQPI